MGSYKFTKETEEQIKLYCYRTFTTVTELFKSFGSSYNTYYAIKKRGVMSTRIAKKLREVGVPIITDE